MQSPAIEFVDVSKNFGSEIILDRFNLSIAKGEFVSILGPSGCGKSTVLRLIAGLESVDQGQLSVPTADATDDKQLKAPNAQYATAFVFQESNLLPWLTAFDNVALPFRITGNIPAVNKINRILEWVGLTEESHHKYPAQLSGGMKMRVSLARALVLEPQTMLLDEPFAALDDLLRTSLNIRLMEIWMREGQTMLFVTHNISEAIFVSQKVLVMGHGSGKPEQIDVDFEYPRHQKVKSSAEFARLFAKVGQALENAAGKLDA